MNVDDFFSIGKYFVGHTTEYIDLKTAQIGTISIYQRALNETEISNLGRYSNWFVKTDRRGSTVEVPLKYDKIKSTVEIHRVESAGKKP